MAKDQRNVEAITPMEVDFAKWYTDICLKAELVDYASVKGFMILRPYGYAIWENIQRIMDGMFKKTGHVNVAMPVLIPESLLKKEGELVEGFAPEVAWVTMGGSEKLEERLAFRPTSETMFCDHWHNVLQSYRELPMLYNQWCSVIRWEKTTRPFLRSREFWWQEGHTIHETAEEAIAETEQQLNCYADFCRDALAMPVVKGRKTDKEKFAGAEATYTIEAMMKDRKALQSGTSHYFGDKFSRATRLILRTLEFISVALIYHHRLLPHLAHHAVEIQFFHVQMLSSAVPSRQKQQLLNQFLHVLGLILERFYGFSQNLLILLTPAVKHIYIPLNYSYRCPKLMGRIRHEPHLSFFILLHVFQQIVKRNFYTLKVLISSVYYLLVIIRGQMRYRFLQIIYFVVIHWFFAEFLRLYSQIIQRLQTSSDIRRSEQS